MDYRWELSDGTVVTHSDGAVRVYGNSKAAERFRYSRCSGNACVRIGLPPCERVDFDESDPLHVDALIRDIARLNDATLLEGESLLPYERAKTAKGDGALY